MIIKHRRSWIRLLVSFRGSDLSRTWPRIFAVTLVALLVTVYHVLLEYPIYSLTPLPFTLIGIALSIFLGFRNNESYSRFWEGRRLWGEMVNVARSFARQTSTLIGPPTEPGDGDEGGGPLDAFRRELARRTIAYVHAVRHHLRGSDPSEDIRLFLPHDAIDALAGHRNVPLAMLHQIAQRLRWAWRRGWILDFHLSDLDASLNQMTAVQGGCERIQSTPIPFAYTVLLHRIVGYYCLALPFGIVDTTGYTTPLVVLLISYAFFGLDAIGDEVEDPFGLDANDLPLHAITRTIEINLLQLTGEELLRDLPEPVDGVVL